MGNGRGKKEEISVVIPVKDEEKTIEILSENIKSVLSNYYYEIIFIDDGSRDKTFEILKKIRQENMSIKVIQFKKNFGKSDALSAGFNIAKGDIIIMMDGDLQDDPKEIPKFIEKIKEGWDVAVGWRFPRNDPISKRISSKMFNRLTGILTGLLLHDINCGFKAFRQDVVRNITLYGELHRYLPVLASMQGYSVCEVKVKHHKRIYGKSKFGTGRLIKGFIDLITVKFLMDYSRRPLHLFGTLGLASFFLGFIINSYLSLLWIKGTKIGDRPLLMLGVLLVMFGVQFISIGLLGEMIVQSHKTSEYHKIESLLE
jgi:glycosyltransferase involved in cell wall biosynthesis